MERLSAHLKVIHDDLCHRSPANLVESCAVIELDIESPLLLSHRYYLDARIQQAIPLNKQRSSSLILRAFFNSLECSHIQSNFAVSLHFFSPSNAKPINCRFSIVVSRFCLFRSLIMNLYQHFYGVSRIVIGSSFSLLAGHTTHWNQYLSTSFSFLDQF